MECFHWITIHCNSVNSLLNATGIKNQSSKNSVFCVMEFILFRELLDNFQLLFDDREKGKEKKKRGICYGKTYVVSFYFSIFDGFVCGSINSVCCIHTQNTKCRHHYHLCRRSMARCLQSSLFPLWLPSSSSLLSSWWLLPSPFVSRCVVAAVVSKHSDVNWFAKWQERERERAWAERRYKNNETINKNEHRVSESESVCVEV